jgi:DNA-binding PadR family transcriptional regulator
MIQEKLFKSLDEAMSSWRVELPDGVKTVKASSEKDAINKAMANMAGFAKRDLKGKIAFGKVKIKAVKEEVELDEAVLRDRDYEVKDDIVHISKANFRKVHKDFKVSRKGDEMMMVNGGAKGSILMPVTFTEEMDLDEKGPPLKHSSDPVKKSRAADVDRNAARGLTPTGRKKKTRTTSSTQRSLASMREARLGEASIKLSDLERQILLVVKKKVIDAPINHPKNHQPAFSSLKRKGLIEPFVKNGKVRKGYTITTKGADVLSEEVDLDEAVSSKLMSFAAMREARLSEKVDDYTISHKTFSSAVQHAMKQAEKQGYEIDSDEWDDKVATGPRKPSAGKTNKYTIALMKNGKETRRNLQMQVYYDEGRYELNMYIS